MCALPLVAWTQTTNRLRRVTFISGTDEGGTKALLETFKGELKRLGHIEGRDVAIEARWARNDPARLAAIAAEVARSAPDVILTHSSTGIEAARKVTSSIPIVFATAANPVEQGFVKSLQRPGGNITGVVVFGPDLVGKLVEIAREAFPSARRLAVAVHVGNPVHKLTLDRFEPAAKRFGFEPVIGSIPGPQDVQPTFASLKSRNVAAVIMSNQAFFNAYREIVVQAATNARLPLFSTSNLMAESGGLLAYGTLTEENYRRAAALVDKILRGAKPGDLPVEQPERFQLVVNRATARRIGVELSPVTMLRADRVID